MEEKFQETPHTLSAINKSLCWLLAFIMIIMFISYYITVLAEVELTKLGAETMRLRNENVELQNALDNMMSYNRVEELVKKNSNLDTAKQIMEVEYVKPSVVRSRKKSFPAKQYYRWSLGF